MKQRKNKTNQSVVWPTTAYFNLEELHALNPKFVEITLRVRLTNEIEAGKYAEIGAIPGGKGRPPKVWAAIPVTQAVLNKAKAAGINLADGVEKLVNVVSVTPSTPTPQVTPVAPSQATVAS